MAIEVASPAAQHTTELSQDELRAALAVGGLRPAGQSPLVHANGDFIQPLDGPVDDVLVEQLFRKGLLGVTEKPTLQPGWQKALTALADPMWDLSMILGRDGQLNYDRYFSAAALDEDSLVYHRPGAGGDTHQISFPYSPRYVMSLVDDTIGFTPGTPPTDASTDFNYKEYIALTALVDVLRGRALEGLLRRNPDLSLEVRGAEVVEAVHDGTAVTDTRWMVALGNAVSPFEFALDPCELDGILEALQLRGYLTSTEANSCYTPTDDLLAMARSLVVMPAFAAFELTFIKGPEVFEINYFTAVRGIDGVWLFDFFELATPFPRVSLMMVSGEELGLMIERLFEDSVEKTASQLQARRQAAQARGAVLPPVDSGRLPAPPTLRVLKVPPTFSRLLGAVPPQPDVEREAAAVAEAGPPSASWIQNEAPSRPLPQTPIPVPPSPPEPAEDTTASAAPPPDAPTAAPVATAEPVLPVAAPLPPEAAPAEAPCPHCGLPVIVGKKFCRHCGKSTTVPEPVASAPAGPPLVPVPAPPPAVPAVEAHSEVPFEARAATPVPVFPIAPPGATAVTTCQICGMALPEAARFCGHCGANVALFRESSAAPKAERTCPSCSGKLAPNAKFCAFCGYRVG